MKVFYKENIILMTTGTNDNDIKVQYRIGKYETSRKFSTIEEVKM